MSIDEFHKLPIELRNFNRTPLRDLYHKWLTLTWPQSFALFAVFFFLVNLIFGWFFWLLGPGALTNSSGSFQECFFFSVQTLATIGYGFVAPKTTAANVLVIFEAAVGMVTIALLSGLFFGKFSQPRARIRFTQKMLLSQHRGRKSLQFRMANHRMNPIIDSRIALTLLRPETSPEGMRMRKAYELTLELSHDPMFAMSLTAIHDLQSGLLSGVDLSQMCQEQYEFIVRIIGTDATFGQTIYSTRAYLATDIVPEGRWGKIGDILSDGTRVVDLKEFDTIHPEA